MKKIKTYKGYVIAQAKTDGRFYIFTRDEWTLGTGFRTAEWDTCTLAEAIEWIR